MPAVMKKKPVAAAKAKKSPLNEPKAPKAKLISKLGVTAVKPAAKSKHPYNPVKSNRGIVFIKHIPHGFYEEQLKSYFQQFGAVTRTRVARSDRTGRSKGYAFVEFRVPEVAQIAAETMNNYLMFKQVLKTAYIPPDEQKYNYFRQTVRKVQEADGTERLVTPVTQRQARAVKQMNKMPTKKQHENRVERALYKLKKAQEQFASKNININLDQQVVGRAAPAVDAAGDAKPKLTKKQQKAAQEAKRLTQLAKKEAQKNKSADTSAKADEEEDDDAEDEDGEPSAKRQKRTTAAAGANTTLDKLLNETIDESADESDEDFDVSAAERASADVSALDTTLNVSTSSSAASEASTPPKKIAKKAAGKKQQLKNKRSGSLSTATDESTSAVDSSPEPVRVPKKANSLVATGGIQKKGAAKKAKKVAGAAAQAVATGVVSQAVKKSGKLVAKELIQSTAGTVKKVKAGELKQKQAKKGGKRA